MTDVPDAVLLEQFARDGSEAAFAALVERHLALVYSVALRHTAQPQQAQDIAQAVFIILARKAATLGNRTVLPGWLFHTARLTAANFQRAEGRRVRREQEAFMQSTLDEPAADPVWLELAPQLDEAITHLGAHERDALVLRYFQNKSIAEVGMILGVAENTAQKRLGRALEKLRKFFARRGILSPTSAMVAAISAHSIQAAPTALAKTITTLAVAKGAPVSISTSTLIKGTLKIMAWSKVKTSVVAGAVILLTAGTTTVAVKEYQDRRTLPWEIMKVNKPGDLEFNMPTPRVQIKHSIYRRLEAGEQSGRRLIQLPDGAWVSTTPGPYEAIGLGVTLAEIVRTAYDAKKYQVIDLVKLPEKPFYDYVSNLPQPTAEPLQQRIRQQFGIVGQWEDRETDVLLLQLSNPYAHGLQPAESLMASAGITDISPIDRARGVQRGNVNIDQTMAGLITGLWLQDEFHVPIIDETGVTNRFDYVFKYPSWYNDGQPDPEHRAWKKALYDQLGLELVPARRTVKMLVIKKA